MEETCSSCCTGLIKEGPEFNLHFADYGWCAYDSISEELVHRANLVYEEQGIEAAERILIEYYQNEAPGQIDHILGAAPSFSMREGMIRQCFEDHREGRYYASVPLSLIIIDGAVNDYTKKKGFFTAATTVSGTLAQRAEGSRQAIQRDELNKSAVQDRKDKLAALSQRLVSITEKRHMLSTHMDFYRRGILKGNPTASSSRFAEALKELREIADRKNPDEHDAN